MGKSIRNIAENSFNKAFIILFQRFCEVLGDVIVHAGATVCGEGLGYGYQAVPLGFGQAEIRLWCKFGQAVDEAGVEAVACADGTNGLANDEKNALRSEYGQPELTVYPDGKYEITNEPIISDLPKDTVIFNEEQTH